MITFEDGPAQGHPLALSRAPQFLRVVIEGKTVDALDQVNDQAKPEEKIFAYQQVGFAGRMHVHRGGGRGGWYVMASYRLVAVQPSDADMRKNEAWWRWCHDQMLSAPVEL